MMRAFGPVIATRELSRNGSRGRVVVEIGVPRRRRTGEWGCPYRIGGLGRRPAGMAFGEDAVQALQIVFQAIWRDLEPYGLELSWNGEPGVTGFYRHYPDVVLGLEFAHRVEAAIDREIHKEARRLKRQVPRARAARKRKRRSRPAAA